MTNLDKYIHNPSQEGISPFVVFCLLSGIRSSVWNMSGMCLSVSGGCLGESGIGFGSLKVISIKKKLECFSQSSAAPFYPSGLQWVKNAQKVEIENRPWPYFFSQLDPMLFRVFSLKLTKETPCGHRQVNSKIFIFCPITTPR